jgi:hypothetical protein
MIQEEIFMPRSAPTETASILADQIDLLPDNHHMQILGR